MHIYGPKKIHYQRWFQQRFSMNLWAGIVNSTLIAPYEVSARFNREYYIDFLRDVLSVLLEDVSLHLHLDMLFLHDVCPGTVRNYPNTTFLQNWVGQGGQVALI